MPDIRFGTDGWRGLIARDFTFDRVALCAQGVARYLRQKNQAADGLVVGYDTRFASEEFAGHVAEVLAGNGIRTFLCDRAAPTPVVSYSILEQKAAGAAIITASHNPALWNGFKYKPEYAGSASPEITARLEKEIREAASGDVPSLPLSRARDEGLVTAIDPMPPYIRQLSRLADLDAISGSGLKIAVDAMYGAGAGYLSAALGAGAAGISIDEMHAERNPSFPGMERPEPIASNLSQLSRKVVETGADLGIAFDGDADRVGVIDEKGEFITPLQTHALLAHYLLDVRGERGALVKSITSSSMMFKLGERYSVPVFETPVGFKYICPIMLREDALMGGEESGGYGFRGHIPERDGIVSGLLILEYMARTGLRPSELLQRLYSAVGPHQYSRRDVSFLPEQRDSLLKRLETGEPGDLGGLEVTSSDTLDGRRFRLASGAWLLVRFSGTESLLRIYAEAESPQGVDALLDDAEEFLGL